MTALKEGTAILSHVCRHMCTCFIDEETRAYRRFSILAEALWLENDGTRI